MIVIIISHNEIQFAIKTYTPVWKGGGVSVDFKGVMKKNAYLNYTNFLQLEMGKHVGSSGNHKATAGTNLS